jgi:hypothetical protein
MIMVIYAYQISLLWNDNSEYSCIPDLILMKWQYTRSGSYDMVINQIGSYDMAIYQVWFIRYGNIPDLFHMIWQYTRSSSYDMAICQIWLMWFGNMPDLAQSPARQIEPSDGEDSLGSQLSFLWMILYSTIPFEWVDLSTFKQKIFHSAVKCYIEPPIWQDLCCEVWHKLKSGWMMNSKDNGQ